MSNNSLGQVQRQSQKQVQRLSQRQIQAVSFLGMKSSELRNELLKEAEDNPALEIVKDYYKNAPEYKTNTKPGVAVDTILENQEDRQETLQEHLLFQLNMQKISDEEYDLCQKLIYNLDKNGCYGSMQAPESFLDASKPTQTKKLLEKCISRIQKMDPVGTCCKNIEESLYVQAQIAGDASELTLFILDGHLNMLSEPETSSVIRQINSFKKQYYAKAFTKPLSIENVDITPELVQESISYIRTLNPIPARDYVSDTTQVDFEKPDVVVTVTKEKGIVGSDDFPNGIVKAKDGFYFQVKYSSGMLPEVRISAEYSFNKEQVEKARAVIENLAYRESTMILQACAIVKAQLEFFEKGPGNLVPLTRRQIAQQLQVHESTVSRMTGKNNSKYFQTDWGTLPSSYFFSSGVQGNKSGEVFSAEHIKVEIVKLIEENRESRLSDIQLTKLLNDEGIKIARRTVAKYRAQLNLGNSFERK